MLLRENIYQKQGKDSSEVFQIAQSSINNMIKINKENPFTYAIQAKFFYDQKQYTNSAETAIRALNLYSDMPETNLVLSLSYYQMNEVLKSAVALKCALDSYSSNVSSRFTIHFFD